MPTYRFTVSGGDQQAGVEAKILELPDDNSAWDVGVSLIRELLIPDPEQRDARVMEIAEGQRIVASIAFDLAGLREKRTLQ